MQGLGKLIVVQAKLFLREPVAIFFTLAFPVLLLLMFGSAFGQGNKPLDNGPLGAVDLMVAGFSAIIIATVAFQGLPVTTATAREKGILRRFYAARVSPGVYFLADIIVNLVMTLIGVILLIIAGKFIYHLRFEGVWLLVLGAFVLCALAFFALGYVIASLAPTTRIAQAVGQMIFFPMMFLSGATIPLQEMPKFMQTLTNFIPLKYAVNLIQGLWAGDPISSFGKELLIIVIILVISTFVAIRTFKWE